jgi:hypothetical protein
MGCGSSSKSYKELNIKNSGNKEYQKENPTEQTTEEHDKIINKQLENELDNIVNKQMENDLDNIVDEQTNKELDNIVKNSTQ